jgi:predicted Holliday junction resolvase-like endonuclease
MEILIIAIQSIIVLMLMVVLRLRTIVIKTLQQKILVQQRTLFNQMSSIRLLRARVKSLEEITVQVQSKKDWPETIE